MINERGWMASAGHDSTTERKSFLFSLWTADSELRGVLHRLLKWHLRAAVVITPITTSQHSSGRGRAWGFSLRKEGKGSNDIS